MTKLHATLTFSTCHAQVSFTSSISDFSDFHAAPMKLGVMFSMTRSVFLRVWLVEGITSLVLPRTGSWSAGFHSQPEPEAELQMLLPFRTTKAPLYEYCVSLHGARTCRVSWACVWQHGQQTLARPRSSEPQHSAKLLVRRLGPRFWAFASSNTLTQGIQQASGSCASRGCNRRQEQNRLCHKSSSP